MCKYGYVWRSLRCLFNSLRSITIPIWGFPLNHNPVSHLILKILIFIVFAFLFKIEIQNLPKFYGMGQMKKLLNKKLNLNTCKLKPVGKNFMFVTFRYANFNSYIKRWRKGTLDHIIINLVHKVLNVHSSFFLPNLGTSILIGLYKYSVSQLF